MRPDYPATPPGRGLWRFVHFPLVTLVLGFVIVAAVALLYQVTVVAGVNRLGPQGPVLDVVMVAGGAAMLILGYRLFNRFVERRGNVEFATAGALRELLAGIAGGVLLFSAVVAVIAAFGGYRVVGWGTPGVLLSALGMAIASGVLEEILFRALLFRLIEQWLGSWVALGLSALVFGLLHLGNPNATLLAGIAIALEAGVLLAAVYMWTRRLWAAIGLHGAWNFAQGGIYGFRVSGTDVDAVLRPVIDGPVWLTGGAFGAEASLPAILLCSAAGGWMLVRCVRQGRIVPLLPRRGNDTLR